VAVSLKSIYMLVFVLVKHSVYCEIGSGFLNFSFIVCVIRSNGHSLPSTKGRRTQL